MRYVICDNIENPNDWYLEYYESKHDDSPMAFGQFKTWGEAFRHMILIQTLVK